MLKKLLLVPLLSSLGLTIGPQVASAIPLGAGLISNINRYADETIIQKAWHEGLPHRRIIGNRVYGGTCPPRGCPAWTQPDLAQDPYTGEWYNPETQARSYYEGQPNRELRRYRERRRSYEVYAPY